MTLVEVLVAGFSIIFTIVVTAMGVQQFLWMREMHKILKRLDGGFVNRVDGD